MITRYFWLKITKAEVFRKQALHTLIYGSKPKNNLSPTYLNRTTYIIDIEANTKKILHLRFM